MMFYIVLALLLPSCLAGGGGVIPCTDCIMDKCSTYLDTEEHYTAEDDADTLHRAYLSGNTFEETLKSILFHRTTKERLDIVKAYEELAQFSLILHIQFSPQIKFGDLFVALLKRLDIYLADELFSIIKANDHKGELQLSISSNRVLEILVNIPGCMNTDVTVNYVTKNSIYPLMDGIKDLFHGEQKKTLMDLMYETREECSSPEVVSAKADAQALIKAGVKARVTHKRKFREIFTTRCYPQLREILKQYESIRREKDTTYKSIATDLESVFRDDDTRTLYSMMVQIYTDQPRTLAIWLEKAIYSKMYSKIVFIIRISLDSNLADVKAAYYNEFKVTLEERITNSILGEEVKDQLKIIFQSAN